MKFTNAKDGTSIESNLSFDEARKALKGLIAAEGTSASTKAFAASLVTKAAPSPGQKFWIYKLAEEFVNPVKKETIAGGEGFKKVAGLFETAKSNGLNRRAIRLQTDKGAEVKLTPAAETGRNSGFIYIKVNNEYMGKIAPDGQFSPVQGCTDEIKMFVQEFGNSTVQMARQYGKRTGSCCFCARQLDTAESNAVGYGPICAEKYGLPWGDVVVKTVENKKVNIGNKRDDSLTPRPNYREAFEESAEELRSYI
jgi:hypothetical protein